MKEKSSTSKIIGIILCVLAVLIMILLFFASFEHREIRNVCEKYYDSLEYKKPSDAYEYLSSKNTENMTLQAFTDDYDVKLKELETKLGESIKYDCKIISENRQGNSAEIILELKTYGKDGNTKENLNITLVKEKNKWKIDKF